ncbi:MAG: ISL3 family transposase [Chloroflexia bacterium]|nr:ISL3 family transposase [Chloroflexia bacterium]
MAKRPTIAIPLDLPDVDVIQTNVTSARELLIEVRSTLTSTTCRKCGRTITDSAGTDRPIRLRHLPILGMQVWIEIRPKRFRCPFCDDHPTTTQVLSWYTPNAPFTKAFEQHMLVLLINSTIADVGQKADVAPDAVLGVINRWIETTAAWDTLPPFTVIGIDEIALKKGHRDFVAIVSAQEPDGTLHLLAVLPDRTKATMVDWLQRIPTPIRQRIRTVCTDMWEAYVRAVEEVLPHAAIVIDRFHMAMHAAEAVDTLRKQELKRLRKTLSHEQADTLKHTMWLLRKRGDTLTEEERDRRDHLLSYSLALEDAYQLREELTRIFDRTRSKAAGLRRLKRWRRKVIARGVTCFNSFLKLLDTWLDGIANYFRKHQTSGFVEGLNNKLKVLKRRCFGMTNHRNLFQRITLDLEGYRRFRSHTVPTYEM